MDNYTTGDDRYITVSIGRKSYYLHILICKVFIRDYDHDIDKFEINHKNGKKHDNLLTNLEICTHAENVDHAAKFLINYKHGGYDHTNHVEIDSKFLPNKNINKPQSNIENWLKIPKKWTNDIDSEWYVTTTGLFKKHNTILDRTNSIVDLCAKKIKINGVDRNIHEWIKLSQ
jgi:hypothetical protein